MEEILPLSAGEVDWVAKNVDFLLSHEVDVSDVESLDAMYGDQLTSWLAIDVENRPDANTFINVLGVGLGEHLVRRTKLEWRIFSDEQGTELVVNLPNTSLALFPLNAVAKRWVEAEPSFMVRYVEETLQALERLDGTLAKSDE